MSFGGGRLPGAPWDNAREPSSRDASAKFVAAAPAGPGQRDALSGPPRRFAGGARNLPDCRGGAPRADKRSPCLGSVARETASLSFLLPAHNNALRSPRQITSAAETNPAGMRARLARSQPSRHGTLPRCLSVQHSGCSFPPNRQAYLGAASYFARIFVPGGRQIAWSELAFNW